MRVKIPLISQYEERIVAASKDAHIINCYLEKSQGNTYDIVKRPGLTYIDSPHASATGFGAFYDPVGGAGYGAETLFVKYDGTNWDLYRFNGDGTTVKIDDIPSSALGAADVFVNWTRAGTSSSTTAIVFGFSNDLAAWLYIGRTSVAKITDGNFNGCHRGLAYLDGYVFASDGNAIQNSNLDDPTTWTAADTITPQTMSEPKSIYHLNIHKNHIVAFGPKSIEFFRNAGYASGSPLAPRRDIIYNSIGALQPNENVGGSGSNIAVHLTDIDRGERIAFISQTVEGRVGVHLLDNFNVIKISDDQIDKYLNQDFTTTRRYYRISSFTTNGKTFICLSIRKYDSSESYKTFVCDIETRLWTEWQTDSNILTGGAFEVVSGAGLVYTGTTSVTQRYPLGSVIQMSDGKFYYLDKGVYQDTDSGATARDITIEIVTPKYVGSDGTHGLRKYMRELRFICDRPSSSENVSINYSDDDYQTFSTAATLDISNVENKLIGLGSFIERAIKITHANNSAFRAHHLEANINTGTI